MFVFSCGKGRLYIGKPSRAAPLIGLVSELLEFTLTFLLVRLALELTFTIHAFFISTRV